MQRIRDYEKISSKYRCESTVSMKLQYKRQGFQATAAEAVVSLFVGQPRQTVDSAKYFIDANQSRNVNSPEVYEGDENYEYHGYKNQLLTSSLVTSGLVSNIAKVQRRNDIPESTDISVDKRFTIEMETGTGKTYTYIKTMYELNRHYGWTKFIVVVPSIAIREGAFSSFESTAEHFNAEYNKRVRFFIYNSKNLTEIRNFAQSRDIQVMIINNQAFTGGGKDTRRIIHDKIAEKGFFNRKPIEVIAETNPIVILDEPQSLKGDKTVEMLKLFRPLFMLEYSATPPKTGTLIYRLDALDAYNMKLVKKIRVKGIHTIGSTASTSYVFAERIETYPDRNPEAILTFEYGGKEKVRLKSQIIRKGDDLYQFSNKLEQYHNGYTVVDINAIADEIRFENGTVIRPGETVGNIHEEQIRTIQIRETIKSHLKKESALYDQGIKVLSLFFIDEVAKYRLYDSDKSNGFYAEIFEEQYRSLVNERLNYPELTDSAEYLDYLKESLDEHIHDGYFSRDKKNRLVDCKFTKRNPSSNDSQAYDWILKNKEKLLSLSNPVRFLFSHSALKEGWDNPNVFQICTLKQSEADTRKRQEVGRGMRLCVNQRGERQDENILKHNVHNVNVLTVIASESYESFTSSLQTEIKEIVHSRPIEIKGDYFAGMYYEDKEGVQQLVSDDLSMELYEALIINGYVSKKKLTDKFYEHRDAQSFYMPDIEEELICFVERALGYVYNPELMKPENELETKVKGHYVRGNFDKKEFQELWERIRPKTTYLVDFEEKELIRSAIARLDKELHVQKVTIQMTVGSQLDNLTTNQLDFKKGFKVEADGKHSIEVSAKTNEIKYDLIGQLTDNTGLTRKTVCDILQGVHPDTFAMYAVNPEEFIRKSSVLINRAKGATIIQGITYRKTDESYDASLFTKAQLNMEGKLGVNAIPAKKHLFDIVVSDSKVERDFAEELEAHDIVKVYCKLPNDFYINTPLGNYNPDWAIAMEEGSVTHIYFVAETKGSIDSLQLRGVEEYRAMCAREHFKAISNDEVKYEIVNSYSDLLDKMR